LQGKKGLEVRIHIKLICFFQGKKLTSTPVGFEIKIKEIYLCLRLTIKLIHLPITHHVFISDCTNNIWHIKGREVLNPFFSAFHGLWRVQSAGLD